MLDVVDFFLCLILWYTGSWSRSVRCRETSTSRAVQKRYVAVVRLHQETGVSAGGVAFDRCWSARISCKTGLDRCQIRTSFQSSDSSATRRDEESLLVLCNGRDKIEL